MILDTGLYEVNNALIRTDGIIDEAAIENPEGTHQSFAGAVERSAKFPTRSAQDLSPPHDLEVAGFP